MANERGFCMTMHRGAKHKTQLIFNVIPAEVAPKANPRANNNPQISFMISINRKLDQILEKINADAPRASDQSVEDV